MTTFSAVLADLVRRGAGRPLVTFYLLPDHPADRPAARVPGAGGERIELSVATYANWVSKTAGLLVEECEAARGDRLLLDLPTHWLGPVFLGAAWTVGLEVVWDSGADDPGLVVCGPEGLATWGPRAGELPVVASALHPLGGRFEQPLPPGVRDFGVEVWSQPDAFVDLDPPGPDDLALAGETQAGLWASAAATTRIRPGDRVLCTANPASADGVAGFVEPLLLDGSVVLVAGDGQDGLEELARTERVTARWG